MLPTALAATVLASAASAPPAPGAPVRLRVEYMEAPLGVHVNDLYPPRFSWSAGHSQRNEHQTAYQLVLNLSSSGQRGSGSVASVWDSGRVVSNLSQLVPIADSVRLTADTACASIFSAHSSMVSAARLTPHVTAWYLVQVYVERTMVG